MTGVGQTMATIAFQSCDFNNGDITNPHIELLFLIARILYGIFYIPAFVGLYSVFSIKLVTIFQNTMTPVSKLQQKSFTIFRILPIMLLLSSVVIQFLNGVIGLIFISLAIVCDII